MAVTRKPKSVEEFIHGGNLDQVIEHLPGAAGGNTGEDVGGNEPINTPDYENITQNNPARNSKKEARASHDTTDIQPVKLRLPQTLLEQIDKSVSKRKPSPSRHQWILEAMYEKLSRDISE